MCPCYRPVLPALKRRGWRDCSTNDSPLLLAGTSLSSSGHCLGWMVAASPEDWLTAPSFSRLPLAPTTVRTKCRRSPKNPANPPFHLSTYSLYLSILPNNPQFVFHSTTCFFQLDFPAGASILSPGGTVCHVSGCEAAGPSTTLDCYCNCLLKPFGRTVSST